MNTINHLAAVGAEVTGTIVILAALAGIGTAMVRYTVRTLRRWNQS